jgi:hypothetical protein
MSSIYVFCRPDELRDWLAELCQVHKLQSLRFDGGQFGEYLLPEELVIGEGCERLFLFPFARRRSKRLTMNDVRSRDWGWGDVTSGGLAKTCNPPALLLSDIVGEKATGVQHDPRKWVDWLKRRLKLKVGIGVLGRNVKTGGRSVYKDIWHTDGARDLRDAGFLWKQFVDANSVFEPLTD